MIDHELRQSLNDELHGRTGLRITAPARITHLAFTLVDDDPSPLEHVRDLALKLKEELPAENALHHHFKIDGGSLRFERHGEFYRIAVIAEGAQPKGTMAADLLPPDWLENLPGKRLVAINTHLLSAREKTPTDETLLKLFGHDDLAASVVAEGKAIAWTDFRIHTDGFSRWLVQDKGLTPLRLGRVIRRVHEIETYRMMSLLALPLARTVQRELRPLEQELLDVIVHIADDRTENDAIMLARLSKVARQVEELSNRTNYRFAATRAYAALVEKRVAELHEVRVSSYQRIGIFLDRRFSPAIATCNAVMSRIESLAQRSERANNLLRTRVDIALEAQNQSLLRSMDARAKQQLVLQETVEGLSIVAISYYLFNLIAKFAEGLQPEDTLLQRVLFLVGVPATVALSWFGLRFIRRRTRR
jgi:uncharacterized membrane-anchored protein